MDLCLDIGNSHIYGGVYHDDELKLRFRYPSSAVCTSDQVGLFLCDVLERNGFAAKDIKRIGICSVVPSLDYSVTSACIKYFDLDPLLLRAGIKSGLRLEVKNPSEVGADRIANAVAGMHHFPNRDLLIVDLGTATTVCAIKNKAFVGGAIMPGIKIAMEALHKNAAKLTAVDIVEAEYALGKDTQTNIQSGLYFGHVGAIRELLNRIRGEAFEKDSQPVVIGSGGFAYLFEKQELFDVIIPDLVLHGMKIILDKND